MISTCSYTETFWNTFLYVKLISTRLDNKGDKLSLVRPTFIYSISKLKVVRAMRSNTTAMFLCVFGEKVSIKILYNTYWYAVRLMILSCHVYTDFFDIRLQDQT